LKDSWLSPSNSLLKRIDEIAERRLTAEEFDDYVNAPMSDDERQEILASVAWFKKRYPTPAQRLASARRAFAQWKAGMPSRRSS
jgi:hypothetical protein